MSRLFEKRAPKRLRKSNFPIEQFRPNLVTTSGLNASNTAMAEARAAYEVAQQIEDVNERRRAAAPAIRDMNYAKSLAITALTQF